MLYTLKFTQQNILGHVEDSDEGLLCCQKDCPATQRTALLSEEERLDLLALILGYPELLQGSVG